MKLAAFLILLSLLGLVLVSATECERVEPGLVVCP